MCVLFLLKIWFMKHAQRLSRYFSAGIGVLSASLLRNKVAITVQPYIKTPISDTTLFFRSFLLTEARDYMASLVCGSFHAKPTSPIHDLLVSS